MKLHYILTAILSLPLVLFGQSDTPCGAPLLTPAANCSSTNGTTVGATQQNDAANGGTPSCGNLGPDVWYSFVAPAGGAVNIQTAAAGITNGDMALYQGPCTAPTQVTCDNNGGAGNMPLIAATGLIPGNTYYIRFWRNGGGTGTFSICLTLPGTNTTCTNQTPICSGSPINFTANTGGTAASVLNPGNNYSCLFTSPNPSWYYLEIATGGNLVVDVAAASDVDFAIWGPFASHAAGNAACNTYGVPLDCSYSTAAIEQVNVNGVTPGQVYVLLVTNYANTVQTINVTNGGGTATTNCAIVPLPVGYSSWSAVQMSGVNHLNWTTETEVNNDYFLVERSENGTTWEIISGIEGQGTTSENTDYSYVDQRPFEIGTYYRIKQVDTDGKFNYSNALYVKTIHEDVLEIYPNPSSTGKFNLTIAPQDVNSVEITDTYGRKVEDIILEKSNQLSVSLNQSHHGLYVVQVHTNDGKTIRGKVELK